MPRSILISLALVSLALGVACGFLCPRVDVSVSEGGKYCREISPTAFHGVSDNDFHRAGGAFQFRMSDRDGLLVSLAAEGMMRELITVTDKLRIDISFGTTAPVSEVEWKKARLLQPIPEQGETTEQLLSGQDPTAVGADKVTRDERSFVYNGRKFAKSGDLWHFVRPALLSAEKGNVALQSWNGWEAGGKTSGEGKVFVDVYQLATGRRIAVIEGYRCGYTPDVVLQAYWVTDRDLVLPSTLRPSFILCHLD